jgi:hypothetical protein
LVPLAGYGEDGGEEPPVQVTDDDEPHCRKHERARPRARQG